MSIVASSSLDNIASRIEYKSFIRPRVTHFYQIRYWNSFHSLIQPKQYVHRSFSFKPIPLRNRIIKNENVSTFQNERNHESSQIAKLNDKFATYLETINYLNTQNKKLEMECQLLKTAKQDTEKFRSMYQIEIEEVEKLINETTKDALNSEKMTKQYQLEAETRKKEYNEMIQKNQEDEDKIDNLLKLISQEEAEINLSKRRLTNINEKTHQLKNETSRYLQEIERISSGVDFNSLNFSSEQEALKEDLEKIKINHEFQLSEIKKRIMFIQRPDISKEFRAELAEAIRQIREQFNKITYERCKQFQLKQDIKFQSFQFRHNKSYKSELEMYNFQKKQLNENMREQRVQIVNLKAKIADLEIKIIELEELKKSEEAKAMEKIRIKEIEIADLKKTIEEIKENLELLIKSNSNLKSEIKRYHDLLEGSENSQGLRQVLESIHLTETKMIK